MSLLSTTTTPTVVYVKLKDKTNQHHIADSINLDGGLCVFYCKKATLTSAETTDFNIVTRHTMIRIILEDDEADECKLCASCVAEFFRRISFTKKEAKENEEVSFE